MDESQRIYGKMYLLLFNAVTDALEALRLDQPEKARDLLVRAQQECEELYIQ